MTMRERILAVVQGREHDRVPFVQYDGTGGASEEIWELIGRQNMGLLRWVYLHRMEYPNCRYETEDFEDNGRRGFRAHLHTPAGTLTEERLHHPIYAVTVPRKHFVQTRSDYEVLIAYLRDAVVFDNYAEIESCSRALGDDGIPHVSVARTPYQQLWIEWVSLEDLALHLVDYSDILDDVISLLADLARRVYRLVADAPIHYVVIPDNITAPAIGIGYFRKYCLPLYQELVGIAGERRLPVYAHLDGDLRALWPAITESGIGGIDSLSPPPDNDTSVGQAHAMWPAMRLCPNFPSSLHLADPGLIYEKAAQMCLEAEGSGRLQIQISENVPPGVWRRSFPEIVRAIDDVGGVEARG